MSMDRIESIASFSICDLAQWAAWVDLLLICKHKYYLPAGGNYFVFCNPTGTLGSVVFNGVKLVVVDVAWVL